MRQGYVDALSRLRYVDDLLALRVPYGEPPHAHTASSRHMDDILALRVPYGEPLHTHTASLSYVDDVLTFRVPYVSEEPLQTLLVDGGRCLLFMRILRSGRVRIFITVSQHG